MTTRWAAGAVLAAAVLVHLLLFVRLAVMYAPDYYLGPSGSDRVTEVQLLG